MAEQLIADHVSNEVALSWILDECGVDLHDYLTLPTWMEKHWHAGAVVKIAKLWVQAVELDGWHSDRVAAYKQCVKVAMEPFTPRT